MKYTFVHTFSSRTGERLTPPHPQTRTIRLDRSGGQRDYFCCICGHVIPQNNSHLKDQNDTARTHINCPQLVS